jgi:O-acetyl-ADP-ribose deacetylase (regulator of RNase III)
VTVHVQGLIAAAVFLGLSIFYMAGDMATLSAFQRQARVSFTWLCAALASTLVIFSFFPDAAMSGQAFGFSLGGAAAFVLVILLAGPSLQKKIAELDKTDINRNASPVVKAPEYLSAQEVFTYVVSGISNRKICIITSNINRIVNVDVWVNSENTLMRMSERFHETVSGMIRFYGAERDAAGHIVKDIIADELAEKVAGRTPVEPAVAISTGPGRLSESNHVRAIVHVAAVQIENDLGRRQLQAIDTCVFNVLQEVERLSGELGIPLRSVVFSLFGTGSGRGDRESTARVMVESAVGYLRWQEKTCLREVYFAARSNLSLEALQAAADDAPGLHRERNVSIGTTAKK